MKKTIFTIFSLFPFFSFGGTVGPTLLTDVHFMNNGMVLVYTTVGRSSFPSCATSEPNRFAIDATTAAGKVQLAGLLTAYSAGISVEMHGAENCNVWLDTETLNYFRILK